MFARGYATERWEASPVRTVALYLNSLPDDAPVVTQQSKLFRQLRPFLERDGRLQAAGGRPGRLDPLPALLAAGPFRYLEAPGDGGEILAFLDQSGRCPTRLPLDKWRIWVCNGAEDSPLASFDEGIRLEAAQIPDRLPADGRLPVALFWSAEQPLAKDYTVFVHVVGPRRSDGGAVGPGAGGGQGAYQRLGAGQPDRRRISHPDSGRSGERPVPSVRRDVRSRHRNAA